MQFLRLNHLTKENIPSFQLMSLFRSMWWLIQRSKGRRNQNIHVWFLPTLEKRSCHSPPSNPKVVTPASHWKRFVAYCPDGWQSNGILCAVSWKGRPTSIVLLTAHIIMEKYWGDISIATQSRNSGCKNATDYFQGEQKWHKKGWGRNVRNRQKWKRKLHFHAKESSTQNIC